MMHWTIENGTLTKEFKFDNFVQAVAFVNQILPVAEEMNHHPDVCIHSYNKVKINLFTHSEKQITAQDHALAKRIDSLLD